MPHRQRLRHRRIALRVLPENHIQLLRIGPVRMAKIHFHAFLGACRRLRIGGIDQPIVAVGIIRIASRLIPWPREQPELKLSGSSDDGPKIPEKSLRIISLWGRILERARLWSPEDSFPRDWPWF